MATDTGPDLSYATQVMESLMDDECVINGPDVEGEYNPATRQREKVPGPQRYPNPDHPVGRCMVAAGGGGQEEIGQVDISNTNEYEVDIPVSVTGVKVNDIVTIASARRDQGLVGQRFRVDRIVYETFAVSRTLICEVDR